MVLDHRYIQKQVGRKRRLVCRKDELIFIPLLPTLQQILNNSLYLQKVSVTFYNTTLKLY